MRMFVAMTAVVVVACVDVYENGDPKVCSDLSACFAKGTWTASVESHVDGRYTPAGGTRGVVTFDKNMTGTTTETFLLGYADGQYYSGFTYEIDAAKFTLTISYTISQNHPTQSTVYTITSAYENKIEMETPMANGKLIILLTR